MAKILDTKAYLDTVCDLLADGQTGVPVTIAGTSMTPFLDPGDTVFLDLPGEPTRPGDILLFTRSDQSYVLHRCVGIFPDGSLELLGDAQILSERVRPSQVRAVVTAARHGGKLLDSRSLRWQFFRGFWRHLGRSRIFFNRLRNHIRARTKKR